MHANEMDEKSQGNEPTTKNTKTRFWLALKHINEFTIPLLTLIVEAALAFIAFITTLVPLRNFEWTFGKIAQLLLGILAVALGCWALVLHWKTYNQYCVLQKRDKLSKLVLRALKDANEHKRRDILRPTYGNVPEWNPVDYTRNILLLDEHEHIRSILYSLQKIIIESTEGLTEDDITVDLVACYPNDNKNGYHGEVASDTLRKMINSGEKKNPWRIITSGDHTSGGSITQYLQSEHSFYARVDKVGYEFCNDKKNTNRYEFCNDKKNTNRYDLEENATDQSAPKVTVKGTSKIDDGKVDYILTQHDKHDNEGSIVGIVIELRIDAPEQVFMKGILTITTYGTKLYDGNQNVSEDEYKALFKECVLDSFKALIRSEFAQIYIRHALRDGLMCPKTGRLLMNEKEEAILSEESATYSCPWSGKKCRFQKHYCQTCAQIETGWLEKCLKTE